MRWLSSLRLLIALSVVSTLFVGALAVGAVDPPALSANPQFVPFGQFTTSITYNTFTGTGYLYVTHNGVTRESSSGKGTQQVDVNYIASGSYLFTLRSAENPNDSTNIISTIIVAKKGPNGATGASVVLSQTTSPLPVTPTTTFPAPLTIQFDSGNDTPSDLKVTYPTAGATPQLVDTNTFDTKPFNYLQSGLYKFDLFQGGTPIASAAIQVGMNIAVTNPGGTSLLSTSLSLLQGAPVAGNYVDSQARPVLVCVGSFTNGILTGILTGNLPTGSLPIGNLNLPVVGGLLSQLLGNGLNLQTLGSGQELLNAFNASGVVQPHVDLPNVHALTVISYVHEDTFNLNAPVDASKCPSLSLTGAVVQTLLGQNGNLGTNFLNLNSLLGLNIGLTSVGVTPAAGTTIDRTDYYLI